MLNLELLKLPKCIPLFPQETRSDKRKRRHEKEQDALEIRNPTSDILLTRAVSPARGNQAPSFKPDNRGAVLPNVVLRKLFDHNSWF